MHLIILNECLISNITYLLVSAPLIISAPTVKGSGKCGALYVAEPLDACSPLTNNFTEDIVSSSFALIIRGGCSFEDKIRRAQNAGFDAAIVYDNEDGDLVASNDLFLFHNIIVIFFFFCLILCAC